MGPQGPIAHLYFVDAATLLKTLTPRRFELLRALRRRGPLPARALAAALKRGNKSVAADVKALARIGLIKTDADGRFHVPWDRISTHVELAA